MIMSTDSKFLSPIRALTNQVIAPPESFTDLLAGFPSKKARGTLTDDLGDKSIKEMPDEFEFGQNSSLVNVSDRSQACGTQLIPGSNQQEIDEEAFSIDMTISERIENGLPIRKYIRNFSMGNKTFDSNESRGRAAESDEQIDNKPKLGNISKFDDSGSLENLDNFLFSL